MFIRVGDTSLDTSNEAEAFTFSVSEIRQHPNYDPNTLANDICILKLSAAVSFTEYPNIKPACLPNKNQLFSNWPSIVSGWGTVGSGSYLNSWLHEVNITIYSDGDCGSMNAHMTDDMLCAGLKAGGKDACQGDSGGPLVVSDASQNNAHYIAGVVSWGFGCADADALGIYAEVSHFHDWIYQNSVDDWYTCAPLLTPGPTAAPTPSPATATVLPTNSTGTTVPTNTTSGCGNCVFPFMYGGRIHDRCTTIDGDEFPWCSKTFEWESNWEYCSGSSCPGMTVSTTEQMSIGSTATGSNVAGSCCK